jgi:heavy metal sensor kinase
MRLGLSISLRLTLWYSAIFLCGFIIFGVFIWFDLSASLSNGRDRTLGRRAERVVELIRNTENDSALLRQTKYKEFVEATPEGRLIQVYSLEGERLLPAAGPTALPFPWPKVPSTSTESHFDTWFGGQPYRVFVRSGTLNNAPVRIFVAGSLTDNRSLLGRLAEILERSIPVMLLVSALAGYFISRRALRPVVHLTEYARSITIGNLAARLPVSPVGDELAQLARTFNEMLTRLEEAVKRITQFTADASHELRSPISFIRTTSEYALSTPGLDPETTEAFQNIVRETEHSSRLLEDMLQLARSDAGRAQIVCEPVCMAEIVREVIARLRLQAEHKRQRLVEKVLDDGVELFGDAMLLRRLVWILVDNAIKYTASEGCIEVVLARAGENALFKVSDNGMGIPQALLPQVFDRFFRVDASRGEQEGTGLGLAIAKWIAEAHRAQITAVSREQDGTTFEVTFPLNGTRRWYEDERQIIGTIATCGHK